MSSKSSKGPKKLSVPREMAEIQKNYQQLCASAGQVQYQIVQYQKELEKLNGQLEDVNREAASRQQLDQAKAREAQEEKKD